MIFASMVILVAISISAVSAYYSIVGLISIFPGAFWPIVIMGGVLEAGKVITCVWLHKYWARMSLTYKSYFVPAVLILMMVSNTGIYGYLSMVHSSDNIDSSNIAAQVALFDEKIAMETDAIALNRKALAQLDAQVDSLLSRTDDARGAEKAATLRKNQQAERKRIQEEIAASNKLVGQLRNERAPIAASARVAESHLGPIKYIADIIYGGHADKSTLEGAVKWVIIMLVCVFDPLALALVVAGDQTLIWVAEDRKRKREEEKQEKRREALEKAREENLERELKEAPTPPDIAAAITERDHGMFGDPDESVSDEGFLKSRVDLVMNLAREMDHYKKHEESFNKAADEIQEEEYPGRTLTAAEIDSLIDDETVEEEILIAIAEAKAWDQAVYEESTPADVVYDYEEFQEPEIVDQSYVGPVLEWHEPEEPVVEEIPDDLKAAMDIIQERDDIIQQLKAQIHGLTNMTVTDHAGNPVSVNFRTQVSIPDFSIKEEIAPVNTRADFGTVFPGNPNIGDLFLRVDQLPSRAYKWNGVKWIDADRSSRDRFVENGDYLEWLVAKLGAAEYELEDLSSLEQEVVTQYLEERK